MRPLTLWLIFALLVTICVFVPEIVRADELVVCKDGLCVIQESILRVLVDMARGKVCT